MVEQDSTPDAPTHRRTLRERLKAKNKSKIRERSRVVLIPAQTMKVARPPLLRREIPVASTPKKESR